MKEDSTGVSPVIATILLIAITVVAVGVVMAFVAGIGTPKAAPITTLDVKDQPGTNNTLLLSVSGGAPLKWAELRISVTLNAGSTTVFEDPTASNNALDTTKSGTFEVGADAIINGLSENTDLLSAGNYYRVVVKHEPSGTILRDTTVRVTSD